MAFASNAGGGPMADMNVTPLVDVMLVLLIIFMVTAPPLSYQIQVDLPQKSITPPTPPKDPPDPIKLHIDASGEVTWDGTPVPMTVLQDRFQIEAELAGTDLTRQPMLEIETDKEAPYESLAKVLARAKNANMVKISFVEPGV